MRHRGYKSTWRAGLALLFSVSLLQPVLAYGQGCCSAQADCCPSGRSGTAFDQACCRIKEASTSSNVVVAAPHSQAQALTSSAVATSIAIRHHLPGPLSIHHAPAVLRI